VSKKNNTFLFTGQLRHKKKLVRSIIELKFLFLFDEIIISTWKEELNSRVLILFFRILNIKLIINNSEPDPFNLGGNFYHQMKSMEYGLKEIDERSFVFKSRTDVHIKPKAVRKILSLDYQTGPESMFDKKIWIPYFEVTRMFYFGDECFYGTCKDLKKFTNYEAIFDSLDMDYGISHIRRFAYPYTKLDRHYLTLLKDFGNSNYGPERFSTLKKRLGQTNFLEYLKLYYKIIDTDFRVGIEDESSYITFRKWSEGNIFPKSTDIHESLTESSACLNLGHIFSYSETWHDNLVDFYFD
jgi:hypothetical protein